VYRIWVKPDVPRQLCLAVSRQLCLAVSVEELRDLGFDGRHVLIYSYSNKQ